MLGETPRRAHDPDVDVWAGIPANRPWPAQDTVGGAGWSAEDAERACIGEAIERWQTHPLPSDRLIRSRYAALDHAIDPTRFVRFHRDQEIPYERLERETEVDWVRCRVLGEGTPIWAPADLVFLDLRPDHVPRFGPTISTGWSAHATAQAALASATLEAIERDAIVGAWWGSYPLVEVAPPQLDVMERLARRNLQYRWYRVVTPRAAHVTIVTLEGEDTEGYVFSIGSACRLDRRASFTKAALEAVQGRHYVRYLLSTTQAVDVPASFAEHAAYYSRRPQRLAETCLRNADRRADDAPPETLREIIARLPPAAFRHATPPALVDLGYVVMRVIIPELQPLHGDHRLPFLGGPLWNRPLADWATMPPHPFA
jgi:ribosomal protein S12 methylthiotransferase accessory factor